jgi:hypothetical protein
MENEWGGRDRGMCEVGWVDRGLVPVAGSSQNGAAMTPTAQTRMRETRELMQKEARGKVLKKREEIKKQEELGRKEEELRKMEEELWRRPKEIMESKRKIRKREEEVRKRKEEMWKGRSNKEERRWSKENKRGFPRFLSRNLRCTDSMIRNQDPTMRHLTTLTQ